MPINKTIKLRGVDISSYQPIPDPAKLNISNLAFCWVKASEGKSSPSTNFVQQYEAVGKSALLRGPYHFFRNNDDGIEQAKYFASIALKEYYVDDLPPMIDVEDNIHNDIPASTSVKRIRDFIDQVVNDFGVQPVIYTNYYYWRDHLGNPTGFNKSPLWLASYSTNPPSLLKDWNKMTIWQYTDKYNCDAFPKPIDADYFYGSIEDLWSIAELVSFSKRSEYHPKVEAIQQGLTDKGFDTHGVDGMFGNNTEKALISWQQANGFTTNGAIDATQWARLFDIKYF